MSTPNWCRMPPWVGPALCDERTVKRARAYVYLLSSWHAGNDPGPREVARMIGVGAGLTAKLTSEVVSWAIENDAVLPERLIAKTGTVAERSEVEQTPKVRKQRNDSGTVDHGYRNASRARSIPERDQRERHTPREAAPAESEPATPTVDPRLAEVIGTRADLLRLLVAPLDPKDPPIRDLDALRHTPLNAEDGPDLIHRVGMGPQRARQLAELLKGAGLPLIASAPPVTSGGPPPRASPAPRRKSFDELMAEASAPPPRERIVLTPGAA